MTALNKQLARAISAELGKIMNGNYTLKFNY